jgi:ankyrin repeat protein
MSSERSTLPAPQAAFVNAVHSALRLSSKPGGPAIEVHTLREALAFLVARDTAGYAPLHHAAANGDAALLDALLVVFAHVHDAPLIDERDAAHGKTALHWAILRSQAHAIQRLVSAGASLVRSDNHGRNALHQAVAACAEAEESRKGFYHNMVRYLLQSGADVNLGDEHGATALHLAAESGDVEMVGILVEIGGSPVNSGDEEGETALFYALREGHTNVAQRLVDFGTELNIANWSNESIYDVCRAVGNDKALQFVEALMIPQGTAGVEKGKELENSANLFGSNTFRPLFAGNSGNLIR